MITCGGLYPGICAFENLLAAVRLASRAKRFEDAVGRFGTRIEAEILRLRDELLAKRYRPGPYRTHEITRPKRRMISAAPFRDRVVQHAVCRVVMPLFERKMIEGMYSNRPGKGTHAAIRKAQEHLRRYRYVLKADIAKYFPSMDHEVLKRLVRRTVRCPDTLWLLDTIIDAGNRQEPVCAVYMGDDLAEAAERRIGLPIGNLASQWFAGVYLTGFDHWVKEGLRCPAYLRYVDDFLLFSDDKAKLGEWRAAIREKPADIRLRLNEQKTRVFRATDGVTFLGQRIWRERRRITRPNVTAARRRLLWNVRQYRAGKLDREGLTQRWSSWKGHAMQADSAGLIDNIANQLRYALGAAG